jgi:hypothetical protein
MPQYPVLQDPDVASYLTPDLAVIKPDLAFINHDIDWARVGPAEDRDESPNNG